MILPIRLRERASQAYFIVDTESGKVYADKNGDGRIHAEEEVAGAKASDLLASARAYKRLFDEPVPGNRTPDERYDVRGPVTQEEQKQLATGGAVDAERSALLLHLDFFDADLDGKITASENLAGWKRLKFGTAGALVKTGMSAAVFGRVREGMAIDVESIGAHRYASTTGIYDAAGRIDHARLDEFLAAFDTAGRPLSFDEVIVLLDRMSAKGTVSRGQFRSLFSVCKVLNKGAEVITREQFRGLFDGSLLHLAAATTDSEGKR